MAGRITVSTLNNDTGVLATQNGMTGIAKAWANFNGSTGAINSAFNVSSVTRLATGAYTVNLTTAMPNTNYSTVSSFVAGAGNTASIYELSSTPRTTSAYSFCTNGGGTAFDASYLSTCLFSS